MKKFVPINVRKIFKPSPGYMLVEPDLKQADAQIVAWEANDESLKKIFREGRDIHTENAKVIFKTENPTHQQRDLAKLVHAVNYGVEENTLAESLRSDRGTAREFIDFWLGEHPGIKVWHRSILDGMEQRRVVRNPFGFRRLYLHLRGPRYGRYEVTPSDFHKGLSWIPQSTVAIITHKTLVLVDSQLPDVQLLLENHDANLYQVPLGNECGRILDRLHELSLVRVPYTDPLVIPVDFKVSLTSWGEMTKLERKDGSFSEGLDKILSGVR